MKVLPYNLQVRAKKKNAYICSLFHCVLVNNIPANTIVNNIISLPALTYHGCSPRVGGCFFSNSWSSDCQWNAKEMWRCNWDAFTLQCDIQWLIQYAHQRLLSTPDINQKQPSRLQKFKFPFKFKFKLRPFFDGCQGWHALQRWPSLINVGSCD